MNLYARSVIVAQLPFPPAEIDTVLAQLGPAGESSDIALFDFFAVRDELRRRHGIQASACDNDQCFDGTVFFTEADPAEVERLDAHIDATISRLHAYQPEQAVDVE